MKKRQQTCNLWQEVGNRLKPFCLSCKWILMKLRGTNPIGFSGRLASESSDEFSITNGRFVAKDSSTRKQKLWKFPPWWQPHSDKLLRLLLRLHFDCQNQGNLSKSFDSFRIHYWVKPNWIVRQQRNAVVRPRQQRQRRTERKCPLLGTDQIAFPGRSDRGPRW